MYNLISYFFIKYVTLSGMIARVEGVPPLRGKAPRGPRCCSVACRAHAIIRIAKVARVARATHRALQGTVCGSQSGELPRQAPRLNAGFSPVGAQRPEPWPKVYM